MPEPFVWVHDRLQHVVGGYPPNYADIAAAFDLSGKQPIFCWGDTIYNPHAIAIDPTLMAHEGWHTRQQEAAGGPAAWWDRYLADAPFRLDQEAEAYGVQLGVFRQRERNRDRQFRCALDIARTLASPMYGSPCSWQEALKLIGWRR